MKKTVLIVSLFLLAGMSFGQTVLFEEPFDAKLKDGWMWINESPDNWKIVDGGLEIRMEPFDGPKAKNILVRDVPDRSQGTLIFEVKLTSKQTPKKQYQQAGLFWMRNENFALKFVKELIDGQLYVFPGKIPMEAVSVHLKWTVKGDEVVSEFKPEGEEKYQQAFVGKIPPLEEKEKDQISLQCWHGLEDEPHWVRFESFKILRE